jgi:hypothetical protein
MNVNFLFWALFGTVFLRFGAFLESLLDVHFFQFRKVAETWQEGATKNP